MKTMIVTALLVAAASSLPPLGAAQRPEANDLERLVRERYAAIDASVVRIRTLADLEYDSTRAEAGPFLSSDRAPLSTYGTGVVVGRILAEGRWEYLVLTNHHVADVSNYVISEGRFLRENRRNSRAVPTVPEETYLVSGYADEVLPGDIRLIEVGRNVRGDMALLRTVGAQVELTPFPGRIGYRPGEVQPGASIVTSGFPYTGEKVVEVGRVVEVDRPHELGIPHEDMTVDVAVEQGQSGSPVFLVEVVEEEGGTRVVFTLIGLLHAREGEERFMVPYELWQETLAENPGTTADRLVR